MCKSLAFTLAKAGLEMGFYFLFSAFTLAQRALAAARILAIPAAEIRRFGRAAPGVLFAVSFCRAQRAR
jgi:hypothetical protein